MWEFFSRPEWWTAVALSVVGSSGIVGFAFKVYGDRQHRQHEREIRQLESELRLLETERQAVLAGLVGRQADTIARIYDLLRKVQRAVAEYTDRFAPPRPNILGQYRKNTDKAFRELDEFLRPNQIWLPKATADAITNLYLAYFQCADEFASTVSEETDEPLNEASRRRWDAIIKRFHTDIAPVFHELENNFRQLLGVRDTFPTLPNAD